MIQVSLNVGPTQVRSAADQEITTSGGGFEGCFRVNLNRPLAQGKVAPQQIE